jgi:hypothetical protein
MVHGSAGTLLMASLKRPEVATTGQPAVSNRWWVELGGAEKARAPKPITPVGSRFYKAGEGFEQERARDCLTDNNMKVLRSADPPEGAWAYVSLATTKCSERHLERIKKIVSLPRYARGVVVDCGRAVRLLVTGTPVGEHLLELTLGGAPSFDCWVHHEWVREVVFDNPEKAMRAFRGLVKEYLSPEAIARAEAASARA